MSELEIGSVAPDFSLPLTEEKTISLSDLKGKKVVLFFYPKDNTSGCTTEAVDFSSKADEFANANTVILGISPDSLKSHDKFSQKHNLTVLLGADEDKATALAYCVWKEKSMYGRKYMGIERTTFLIDAEGKINKIWNKVKVSGHAQDVLNATLEL